ncbi:MAG: Uma2 family endonuclease [Chloroflexota bacterium]|nr:Uma2 family endonuclease [Chloroflexota bacterium]
MPPLTLRLRPIVELTPDQLLALSALNDDLRLELTAEGELIVMAPVGGTGSASNARITAQLTVWSMQDGTGIAFDSSGGFDLPNGAKRSPDAAWVALSRWEALTPEQRETYPPLCPDFVIELKSPSDRINEVKRKMQEWLDNGARLGWLIDPHEKRVYVYRPDTPVEELQNHETISGEPVLPGFVLDLRKIW